LIAAVIGQMAGRLLGPEAGVVEFHRRLSAARRDGQTGDHAAGRDQVPIGPVCLL